MIARRLLVALLLLGGLDVATSCCLGGLGVPTPLYSSASCRNCPNGWFDKRRDTDNVPNYHNVRLYICPMAYAGFQLYSPGRSSCNSGWYPTCYQVRYIFIFLYFFVIGIDRLYFFILSASKSTSISKSSLLKSSVIFF